MNSKFDSIFSKSDVLEVFDKLAWLLIHRAKELDMTNDEIASLIQYSRGYLAGSLNYVIAADMPTRALDITKKYLDDINNT